MLVNNLKINIMKKEMVFDIPWNNKVFVIAEIGINHGGNIEIAKKLIDSAKRAGADAVKFQTYKTEKRTPIDSPIYDVLKKCELPFEAFAELKKYSEENSITFFSTPFDDESVDFLESINNPIYKIASFDVANLPFLKKIARTGKPIIISVGMSDLDEIKNAINLLQEHGSSVALLHCISAYPTDEKDSNLAAIHKLTNIFKGNIIGQSDHTNDIFVPLLAVSAGARIIEKHFKISAEMDCIDAIVSISEEKMKELVSQVRRVELILGNGKIEISEIEKDLLWLKRKVD